MNWKIVNSKGTPLNSFHSNGGWEIKDVFPCSNRCYSVFSSEKEAQEHLEYIIRSCKEQESRWGEWTKKALKFANSLRVIYS